jgi:hypothetical protein
MFVQYDLGKGPGLMNSMVLAVCQTWRNGQGRKFSESPVHVGLEQSELPFSE